MKSLSYMPFLRTWENVLELVILKDCPVIEKDKETL